MTYNRGGHRARLKDPNCLNIIQCKGFERVDKDASAPLRPPVYNAEVALQHDLNYSLHDYVEHSLPMYTPVSSAQA